MTGEGGGGVSHLITHQSGKCSSHIKISALASDWSKEYEQEPYRERYISHLLEDNAFG